MNEILTSEQLVAMLTAIAHPLRMRIIAELAEGRVHVSELARRLGMSRPLLYMHLDRLEKAGLVTGQLELSEDGKAMKYFELVPFEVRVTAETVVRAVAADEGDGTGHAGARHEGARAMTPIDYDDDNVGQQWHEPHPDRRRGGDLRPDLRGGRSDRLELLPAAAAPRGRGGDGVLPEARRGGGRQHERLRAEMAKLAEHVDAVEQLMRDVG